MGLNPEQNYIGDHFPSEAPLSPAEEELLLDPKLRKKFVEPLKNDRPDLDQFTDTPAAGDIAKDTAFVERHKKTLFTKAKHDRAELAEGLLYYAANHGLLGEDIEAIATSEYDDFRNGADMVLEIKIEGGAPIRLVVDVTSGENPDTIAVKKERNEDELRAGQLARVKYFQSEPDFKGELRAPKVVIPLSHDLIRKMAEGLVAGKFDPTELRKSVMKEARDQLQEQHLILQKNDIDAPKKKALFAKYESMSKALRKEEFGKYHPAA